MYLLLAFVLTAAGLLAAALWWIRRTNLAVYPAGRQPLQLRPLPTGCDLGQKLLMASTDAPPATAPATGGSGGAAPARKKPSGPSRRSFLRNMMGLSWLVTLGGFGGASLAFLWPDLRGGFGAELTLPLDEEGILETIRSERQPFEYAPGRAYIVEYSEDLDADGQYAEITNGARVMALYWRCVHLGCKVPWCQSSQWLECPCHGSRYNRWGEWQAGPAARGLDRFPLRVENGEVLVNTGEIVTGPSRQTPSLDQPPEGPSCL
jgi:cytochrome b6-f complex iron-sulfur subunit